MFIYKVTVGVVVVTLGVAAAFALPRLTSEVEAAPTAALAVAAVKSDRLDIRPGSMACLQVEWPYGCQWRPLIVRRASPGGASRDHQRVANTKPGFAVKARSARRGRTVALTSAPAS
jgi:hypothetical protein